MIHLIFMNSNINNRGERKWDFLMKQVKKQQKQQAK